MLSIIRVVLPRADKEWVGWIKNVELLWREVVEGWREGEEAPTSLLTEFYQVGGRAWDG